mgnify:CR=1 FL=1
MTDPVKCDDGHTYERKDIQKWLDDFKGTSPLTSNSCAIISEDHDMRKAIEAYVQQVTKRKDIEDVEQVEKKRTKRL